MRLVLPLVLAALAATTSAQGLKSADPLERVAAVRELAASDAPDREKLLVGALKDDDWEVVEEALVALGQGGSEKTAALLSQLALEAPARRLRRAAAEAAAKLDAEGTFEDLYKKLAKEPERASEALWAYAEAMDGKVSVKAFDRGLKEKEPHARAAAAGALVRLAGAERRARVEELLDGEDLLLATAALDALVSSPDPALLGFLVERLQRAATLPDVVERRLAEAVRAACYADEAAGREALPGLTAKANAAAPEEVRARLCRVVGTVLEARPDDPSRGKAWREDPTILKGIAEDLDDSPLVRRAQAGTLAKLGTEAAKKAAIAAIRRETDGHAMLVLLDTLLELGSVTEKDVRDVVVGLATVEAPRVRERAVVALGVRDLEGVVKTLVEACDDSAWEVATCAAVSLGLQHDEAGLEVFQRMFQHADWRRRAAAIVGLSKLRARRGVKTVLLALEDPEPLVRRTAWEYLKALSNRDTPLEDVDAWKAWWGEVGAKVRMEIPPEVLARREELGYSRDPRDLYKGLDVVVFDSRAGGDRIQDVLGFLEIEHRMAQAGQVDDAGLHPDAIYVANCPGEIAAEDAERLAWFVRAGGYLFASCWSLQETVARSIPGYVQRYETGQEVMDDVRCVPAKPTSAYLRGVFDDGNRPTYALIGAYLIDVLDPELVEVLIDSPECASRWGGGTMAAWFRAGHGVVLDSVNHFDSQGFGRAGKLKKPEERWAYALDHLGLSYAELRATKDEKYWKKTNKAAEEVKDLSVLRLITNFVLEQRKRD